MQVFPFAVSENNKDFTTIQIEDSEVLRELILKSASIQIAFVPAIANQFRCG